ncbi:hypothetical protein CPB84DRAFT_859241 [Gymnopilus junonius]|uniref:Uncharacterized protein n=1 Tax=Gymnopilus junonius TaxID=109634 RepID=A0A9P5NSI0_GYMJU|nr:hypothetical protein CPB84DRAFT_859241 [Gymnopilus junonius]
MAPHGAHAHVWPERIYSSFNSAITNGVSEDGSVYLGPYTRLLYSLFSFDGPFDVLPGYQIPRQLDSGADPDDSISLVVVDSRGCPVMFMELKDPNTLTTLIRRASADAQMRLRFVDFDEQNLSIPILYGIIAYGTRLCFYEHNTSTPLIQPPATEFGLLSENPTVASHWISDVFEPVGAHRLRGIVDNIKHLNSRMSHL